MNKYIYMQIYVNIFKIYIVCVCICNYTRMSTKYFILDVINRLTALFNIFLKVNDLFYIILRF